MKGSNVFKSLLLAAIAAAILAAATPLRQARAQVTNAQLIILPATVQTAAQVNSSDVTNTYYRGVHLVITVSGYVSGSYTPTLQAKNVTTGSYYDLLVGTAITANGQTVLKLYPGIGSSANAAASDILPKTWRVQLNGASTPNMTIAVDAMLAGG